jgi:hypothetical protein
MTIATTSAQGNQALSTLLAQLKAEQAQAPSTTKTQDLKSLGSQIVQALEHSLQDAQGSAASSDPLAQLLAPSSTPTDAAASLFGSSDTSTAAATTSAPSVSDLAALLAKTQPGAAGNQARAAIVASLTSGQTNQGNSLFSFLS